MRISENTPPRLTLRDRTLWISGLCFGLAGIFTVRLAFVPDQPSLLVSAALFLMFGLAFLHATDVTFNTIERICAIRRLDVVRLTPLRLAFEDIIDVGVETAPFPEGERVPSCRLSLATASAIVPLRASYQPDHERFNVMRDTVLEVVLGNRRRPVAVDPVRVLVKEGRIIDAMAILRKRYGSDLTTTSARINELRNAADA
jgi:hypothetical protein